MSDSAHRWEGAVRILPVTFETEPSPYLICTRCSALFKPLPHGVEFVKEGEGKVFSSEQELPTCEGLKQR